jgi:hypothetical protein
MKAKHRSNWRTILGSILSGLCVAARAADYESAHRVQAGDIISADMINFASQVTISTQTTPSF